MTWIDMYSIVDHFTIVPTFVGIYYDTNWIGRYSSQHTKSMTRRYAVIQ